MEWEIRLAEDGSRLTIRAWGQAELQGFLDYIRQALEHPGWKPGTPVLIDLSALDLASFPADHLRTLATSEGVNKDRIGPSRIALLVARPVEFGMARMWELLTQDRGMTRRVFYALDEAEAWLGGGA